MGLPTQTVTFNPDQVAELNRMLADARHAINNHLTVITTAIELIRRDPSAAARLVQTMTGRPELIRKEMLQFSSAYEQAFGIPRE